MSTVPRHWSRMESSHNGNRNLESGKYNMHWSTSESVMSLISGIGHSKTARYAREVSQDQMDKCRMFVEGDAAKNEFYSPDFPNPYPKNINCTRVIEAAQGQVIRLDFRNSFYIEAKEECKFDFLEIRDGAYGFSNLIGRFCGTTFPPEITSKERFLWIHFHSDESIEYSGFSAVYEFLDRSREAPSTDLNCTLYKYGYEGWINSTQVPQDKIEAINNYKVPLDCMWRVQVESNWKIQLKFFDFKLAKPNYCDINFLDIFPEETIMPLRIKNFCGSAGESITSESNVLHIRYYAQPSAINTTTFSILFTAFHDRTGTACNKGEYDCEDATCISDALKCNRRDNCKFRWDEEGCENETQGQSEHVIIIVCVFGLILGGMMLTFLVNCVRKLIRDQKIIREHIRQSKESKLNEMGRNSKSSSKLQSRDDLSVSISCRLKDYENSLENDSNCFEKGLPSPVLPQKIDYQNGQHAVLREYHDMVVQTCQCSPYSSSTTTAEFTPELIESSGIEGRHDTIGLCDIGSQTRESLFASMLKRKDSITSSLRISPPTSFSLLQKKNTVAPPPPFTSSRHSHDTPHSPYTETEQMAIHGDSNMRPEQKKHHIKQCPHQQLAWQQQFKPTDDAAMPEQLSMLQEDESQQHESAYKREKPPPARPKHFRSKAMVPIGTISSTASTTTPTIMNTPLPISTDSDDRKNKQKKVKSSNIKLDIRNSAPDVIIMTSH